MPEHLRALIVILALASVVFAFAKAPACALASTAADFARRRNLWFGVTLTVFLAHNFWVYIGVAGMLLMYAAARERNKLALYFFLLFAVPRISDQIPAFGLIEQVFAIDYVRLLSLAVLLPAYLFLRSQPETERFGRSIADSFIAVLIVLEFFLHLRVDTVTNTLREGAFYAFIDTYLPYYVASRSLKTLEDFRDALMAFVVAALVLSAIGAFEFARHWLLYSSLNVPLGVPTPPITSYLERSGILRALATTGQPIVLGYVLAVALGLFLFIRRSVASPTAMRLGAALLILGLVASLSRGPWVGAAVMLLVFIATGPNAAQRIARLAMVGLVFAGVLLILPAGERIIAYLPFVGTIDADNITYRQRLMDVAINVIKQAPLFGTPFYAAQMEEMRQGQGIIDIVNTFLGVTLSSGLVGLSLFSGFFLFVLAGVYKSMRNVVDKSSEVHLLGQALLSTLVGILVIIYTVSSISVIPAVYWSVAGIGVAYTFMLRRDSPTEIRKRPPLVSW